MQDPSQRTRRRHLIFGLVALATSTVVALTAAEVYLRAAGPDWLELRMRELTAGNAQTFGSDRAWPVEKRAGRIVRFEPGAELTVQHVEYHKTAHFDELGARVTGERRGRAPLIPVLGDSFTFGIGVEDDETFASHLARKSGRRVLNLGVPGFSLKEELDIIEFRHEELGSPPLYVFVAYAGNDLYETWARRAKESAVVCPCQRARLSPFASSEELPAAVLAPVASDLSRPESQNGDALLVPFNQRRGVSRRMHTCLFQTNGAARTPRARKVLRDDLRRDPREVSDRPGAIRGESPYYGIDGAHLDPHAPTRALVKIYEHFGFPVIDASRCLQNSGSVATLYYVQDGHFTSAGHRAFARCLLDEDILERIDLTEHQ